MAQTVYVETTIPSYLAARHSRDLLQAARQQVTQEWWNSERDNYDLCISQIVLDEAAAGDQSLAQHRLSFLADLPLLELSDGVSNLAAKLIDTGILPPLAARDAIHIAAATVNGIDFLLTWNFRHIANAAIIKRLNSFVAKEELQLSVICTPQELFS